MCAVTSLWYRQSDTYKPCFAWRYDSSLPNSGKGPDFSSSCTVLDMTENSDSFLPFLNDPCGHGLCCVLFVPQFIQPATLPPLSGRTLNVLLWGKKQLCQAFKHSGHIRSFGTYQNHKLGSVLTQYHRDDSPFSVSERSGYQAWWWCQTSSWLWPLWSLLKSLCVCFSDNMTYYIYRNEICTK